MKKKNYNKVAKSVIDLEIKALKKLKSSINNSFNDAVEAVAKCQSKIVLCGVGKSGLVAAKIAATLSSVGTPSFSLSANDCSHGDLGSISKKDVLILISNSGETQELKNIIKYANRNRVTLIGMVSKKNSLLYQASDIKILLPVSEEAGLGIVPTSSTIMQMSMGDAIAISSMKYKNFGKLEFKNYHPAGSLGIQLKTVGDLMLTGSKVPFINEKLKMKNALKIISNKKLGVLIVRNDKGITKGIITDGQIRRSSQKNINLQNLSVQKIMTKNPISIDSDFLAVKALSIMNTKKVTSLCVNSKKNKNKTIGVLHIHNILEANIRWMNKKNFTQVFLSFTLLFILVFFFFKYFNNTENQKIKWNTKEGGTSSINKLSSNIIDSIKYVSLDGKGNKYVITSKEGEVDIGDADIMFMTDVEAYIYLFESDTIKITSNYGKYNTKNYDTIFSKNVIITYLNHKLTGEYLDFSIEKNLGTMSTNIIYRDLVDDTIMKADRFEINLTTKDSIIFMNSLEKQVIITGKNKNGNN